jgi:hypothetical protein
MRHKEKERTRPAWAGFKTAEEGRAKICKFLWQKLKNKSNIEKHIKNNFITLLKQFYNSLRAFLELLKNLLELF